MGGERAYKGRLGKDPECRRKPAFQCEPEIGFTAQSRRANPRRACGKGKTVGLA